MYASLEQKLFIILKKKNHIQDFFSSTRKKYSTRLCFMNIYPIKQSSKVFFDCIIRFQELLTLLLTFTF